MNSIRWLILFIIYIAIMIVINIPILYASKRITTKNYQKRYINKKIIFVGALLPITIYLAMNYMLLCAKIIERFKGNYFWMNVAFERVLAIFVLIAFFIIKSMYSSDQNNGRDVKVKNKFPYYSGLDENKNQKFYISQNYKTVGEGLQKISYAVALVISFIEAIFVFNNKPYFGFLSFIFNYGHFVFFAMIPLVINEVGTFLDGELAPEIKKDQEPTARADLFNEMLMEYRKLYKENLLLTIDKDDNVKEVEYQNQDDYIYSKIFTPIVEGDNMIIETENLDTLNDIVPPLINLIFATNRKILFITENDAESIATYEWLKKCNVITENVKQVVQVYTEYKTNDGNIALSDSNVDICIGTVDLLLENKEITKKADTIFSVNVDNIIVNSPINLNILTRILAENKSKKVQYILFTNEVNGLQQSIEGAFYSENFSYQVVRQKYIKNFHAMFYAKERGMLQKKILPAIASDSIGSELPLLITPLKYGFENLYAFSSKEPYEDEIIALHKTSPNLKTYFNNKMYDIEEKVKFLSNEHFAENKDSMIVAYDDTENNLILLLKNYVKYASSRVLINIVSGKYVLRDYMIDNIDFFMQNYDFLGKIVPYHKDGKKIMLFKLINELCLENFEEEYLLNELNRITDVKVNFSDRTSFNAENYVSNTLRMLIREVFGVDIRMDSYLYRELELENAKQKKFVYKLAEGIKYELPRNLFTQINFVTSDQKLKKLDRIPMYEIYQNYAVGQYVVFDGKSYLISSIDDEDGIVNLIYNDSINNFTYLNKKDVVATNVQVDKSENVYNRDDLKYEKILVNADVNVKYSGYYKFSRGIYFKPGLYEYQKNDFGPTPENTYLSHKALIIKITSDKLKRMSEKNRLKLSETIAFLFNEVFKTIYCGANQYIVLRAVASRDDLIKNEINDLYSPIVLDGFEPGIALFVTEDTELEKGILDSFTLKLDTTIIPLISDYLEWLLGDISDKDKEEQIEKLDSVESIDDVYLNSFNNDRLNFYEMDKLDFLKLGKDSVKEYFDLETAREILYAITMSGGNSITATRRKYLLKRKLYGRLIKGSKVVDEPRVEEKENIEPNIEGNAPKNEANVPQNEANVPQNEANEPKNEADEPQNGVNPSKDEASEEIKTKNIEQSEEPKPANEPENEDLKAEDIAENEKK